MKVYFRQLLERLATVSGAAPPVSAIISRQTGIPLLRVAQLMSHPNTTVTRHELELLVTFLVTQWRPWIEPTTTTSQLVDQIRYELLTFDCAPRPKEAGLRIKEGQGQLQDISLE